MSKFKDLVARGRDIAGNRARDYATWRRILLEEFGPSIYPHIIEIRKWSVARGTEVPAKLNCWEFMGCDTLIRDELAGAFCPVVTARILDAVHGGRNGGRVCWIVPGTLCGGSAQGNAVQKARTCQDCDFYRSVLAEEGRNFVRAHLL